MIVRFTLCVVLSACVPVGSIELDSDTPDHTTPVVDCDDSEYEDGLTLFELPTAHNVAVSLVVENGVYVEVIEVDRCGTATPFTDMVLDDFGGFNDPSVVYALVVEEPSFYVFQGVYLTSEIDAPAETPISTQWEWSDEYQDWVAIRDSELGIMIGIFMIP